MIIKKGGGFNIMNRNLVVGCIFTFLFATVLSYIVTQKGYDRGFKAGYNAANYEVSIQCGKALHTVIKSDCSDLYELLMEDYKGRNIRL